MTSWIHRKKYQRELLTSLESVPVTAVVGPRQSGKTTLARNLINFLPKEWEPHFFDLEDPLDLARLDNPRLALENLQGLVILDEVQRRPELFPILRVLADRESLSVRFLVLGSASGDLLRQTSESLAGRIRFIELPCFGLDEVGPENMEKLWLQGGFPRSFLARDENQSYRWRTDFIETFLERDIPNLGIRIPALQLRRFWQMSAHYHGQIWNHSAMARSLGQSDKTMLNYLDILTSTFMVRQLPPWLDNTGKRLVKSPKFYFRDSGLLHALFALENREQVERHPKLGASWEGFALEQIIRLCGQERNCFFWASQGGAELDLFLPWHGKRFGFEFKYSDGPKATKSMHIAREDLNLDRLFVIYPGRKRYALGADMDAWPLDQAMDLFNDSMD